MIHMNDAQIEAVARVADGDARMALNTLEMVVLNGDIGLDGSIMVTDAAIYWMQRMLEGGEKPLYIARRLVRFASEDIGMADSQALQVAVAAYQACHFNGMPECDVNLTHAVTYLAMAPKSNALYEACEETKQEIRSGRAEPVPLQIRNAPTRMMAELDYGKGYEYAHNYEDKLTKMRCLPDALVGRRFYRPTTQGAEAAVKTRLEEIWAWKESAG